MWSFVVLVATGTEYRQTVPCHPRLIYTSVLCILAMKDLGNVPPSVFAPSTAFPPPLPPSKVHGASPRIPAAAAPVHLVNTQRQRGTTAAAAGGGRGAKYRCRKGDYSSVVALHSHPHQLRVRHRKGWDKQCRDIDELIARGRIRARDDLIV